MILSRYFSIGFFLAAAFLPGAGLFSPGPARADQAEEVRQKDHAVVRSLNIEETKIRRAREGFLRRASLNFGYETNAALGGIRKGDFFEDASFSTSYNKPLSELAQLLLRYDLLAHTYHELTDNAYILNNVASQWGYKLPFGRAGLGVNAAYVYYPSNEDGDFFTPRASLFLRHNFAKRFYQQWDAEVSMRRYNKAKALADALDAYQDKQRLDQQVGFAYQLGGSFGRRAFGYVKAKFSTNESNARYQNYYDYISWRGDIGMTYKLTGKDQAFLNAFFARKDYRDRLTVNGFRHQQNDLYSVTAGLRHAINKNALLSLSYRYMQNVSNEPSAEYSDGITSLSLSYQF